MTTSTPASIDSILLYELRPLERTPADLLDSLTSWGYDVSPDEIAASLRRLRQQKLVGGATDYSSIFTVWLTSKGRTIARDRRDLGDWRRMN